MKIIIAEIKNGLKIKIDGLGTFSTYFKNVYVNKSLDTGLSATITNVKCISFKPSKKLKK